MSIARRAASRLRPPCGDAQPCTLFGLASDGVYQADRVTPAAGALLPHRFTLTTHHALTDTVVRRSVLCCTFPSLTAGRRYRPSCPAKPGLSSRDRRLTSKHPASDHPTHFRPQCKASLLTPWPTTHPSEVGAERRLSVIIPSQCDGKNPIYCNTIGWMLDVNQAISHELTDQSTIRTRV